MDVKIRPLVVEDALTSYKWRNDPLVFKYTGNTYNHRISLETEIEWIKKAISNNDEYRCAILVDDVYVGNIYLTAIGNERATYHIFIGDRNFWGKGVAKRASEQIIQYGFEQLHLKKIELKVKKQNLRAYALYKSLGFYIIEEDKIWYKMEVSRNMLG